MYITLRVPAKVIDMVISVNSLLPTFIYIFVNLVNKYTLTILTVLNCIYIMSFLLEYSLISYHTILINGSSDKRNYLSCDVPIAHSCSMLCHIMFYFREKVIFRYIKTFKNGG